MATTLSFRAGSRYVCRLQYVDPVTGDPLTTTGYTATFVARDGDGRQRVLLTATAQPSGTPNALLEVEDDGVWLLSLPPNVTRMLPPLVRWEFELISDIDGSDVSPIGSGVFMVIPEVAGSRAT